MPILYLGNCIDEMSNIDDNSVDLIYTDLPYATKTFGKCTDCEWDKPVDLDKMWTEFMRIKKLHTPIFMSCNVKLGYELMRTCPKKCPFRYDLIWVKGKLDGAVSKSGFLNAKKQPLRSHELIYVFYEKQPFYDISSHTHKFLKTKNGMKGQDNIIYQSKTVKQVQNKEYQPPLPNSLVQVDTQPKPKVIKETNGKNTYGTEIGRKKPIMRLCDGQKYDPPLPNSIVQEDCKVVMRTDGGCKSLYGTETGKMFIYDKDGKLRNSEPRYEPPLPNSLVEVKNQRGKHSTQKPVDLMGFIVKYYSKVGDVVVDCCMGSGSMGVACNELGREFVGIELNPEIYEVACERLYI